MGKVQRAASFLVLVSALLACKGSTAGDVKVNVTCKGAATTVDCDVTHTQGDVAVNVCWDLEFACANGQAVTGSNFCQPVQPTATAQKRIPLSELQNSTKCDKATSSQVKNIKISGV